jgi:CubicO group peptidase (beta-lactamase class C family)
LSVTGLRANPAASPAAAAAPLEADALERLQAVLERGVAEGRMPGAVVHVERGGASWCRAVGRRAVEPVSEPLDEQAVYDCASLTKVVCTATVLARLMQDGLVQPEDPVRRHLPAFAGGSAITLRHLLTHTSGLPAGLPLAAPWQGRAAALELACTRTPTHAPGAFFRYSDVNFILLGEIAARVTGRALEALVRDWILAPLRMRDSGYLPLSRHPAARLVPTEWSDAPVASGASGEGAPSGAATGAAAGPGPAMLRGHVHDPTARRMGGVAGHAGLFSTAADLARFARMVVRGGELDGTRVLSEAAVARMLALASPPALADRRSLGWDLESAYSRARGARYPAGSAGHTGFTGCALWIDRGSGAFHVLLSNRVHPRTREPIVAIYEEVGTLAAQAAGLPPRPGPAPRT